MSNKYNVTTSSKTPASGAVPIGNGTDWDAGSITAGSNITVTKVGTALQIAATGGGSGDFVGPASSTNNALVVFDGTTGKLGKNSAATISGSTLTITTVAAALTGNASTATALSTGRTISISGDLTYASPSFDGSGNVTAAGTLATVNANIGTFGSTTQASVVTVNGKGLVTAASNSTVTPAVGSITGLGTGVSTALAINVGTAGAPVVLNGAGGTPSSITLTNGTGLPASSLTAAVLAANITLGESTGQIVLDPVLSADGTWSGLMEAGTAGTTLAFGDLVYLAVADSRWELTDADADATSGAVKIGICVLAAAGDGSPTNILLHGKIRADTAFPALTVGAPVYVSTTTGDVQTAQPSGTDDVIRIVGYGNTADEMYFCPSTDWMTHT